MADDIQAQLNAAINAARSGDRVRAQQLLQAVVRQDSNNEIAWMWLATTAGNTADKRRYLQRVLEINPNNQTARAAMQQLGGSPSAPSPSTEPDRPPAWRNLVTIGIVGAGVLSVVVLVLVIANAIRAGTQGGSVDPTEIVAFNTALAATDNPVPDEPTATPSVSPTPPSVVVSPNAPTLPPTFTPTDAPTDTPTPIPSATALPLSSYSLLYTSLQGAESSLHTIEGNGTNDTALGVNGSNPVYSPDGTQIAFLAAPERATGESDEEDPAPTILPGSGVIEIFLAPVDDPQNAQQLTNLGANDITSLAWSPDGQSLLYVRDEFDLQSVRVDDPDDITRYLSGEDTGVKTDAVWSPDGSRIVYASDRDTPGLLEIYAYELETEVVERLTDDVNSSFSPNFSPDGTRITFISDRNGDGDVFVMEADGSAARLVTVDDADAEDQTPAWSPDGRWIAFSSNRNDDFQIYLVDPQGNELVQVTDNSRNNLSPIFRPR